MSYKLKLIIVLEYGVPQHRERVFIIGNRMGLKNPYPCISYVLDKV